MKLFCGARPVQPSAMSGRVPPHTDNAYTSFPPKRRSSPRSPTLPGGVMDSTTAPAHTVEQRTRVVIRFAGDSGDGMQLTGDRFTGGGRGVRQRPVDAAGFPGRDPRARRHAARRVELPAALRRPRHPDAGGCAGRAGGDEPGGAEGEPGRPAPRRRADRGHRRVHQAEPREGRLRRRTRSTTARLAAYTVHAVRDDLADRRGARAGSGSASKDAERSKNMFALGLLSWMYSAADRGHRAVAAREVREASRRSPRPTWWPSQPGTPTARPPRRSRCTYEVAPAALPHGHLPADHRQHGAGLRDGRPPDAGSGCRCSWAPTRSPRPRTSCTSSPGSSASA